MKIEIKTKNKFISQKTKAEIEEFGDNVARQEI